MEQPAVAAAAKEEFSFKAKDPEIRVVTAADYEFVAKFMEVKKKYKNIERAFKKSESKIESFDNHLFKKSVYSCLFDSCKRYK